MTPVERLQAAVAVAEECRAADSDMQVAPEPILAILRNAVDLIEEHPDGISHTALLGSFRAALRLADAILGGSDE